MSAIYDLKAFLHSARLYAECRRRYGEIPGVHVVGDAASEFIVAAAVFIGKEMPAADAAEIVFPHPTVSEVLREAVIEAARQRS